MKNKELVDSLLSAYDRLKLEADLAHAEKLQSIQQIKNIAQSICKHKDSTDHGFQNHYRGEWVEQFICNACGKHL